MNSVQSFSQTTQRAVCGFLAAIIVSFSLSVGAVGTHVAFENAVATTVR